MFAKNIRYLRQKYEMTQNDLANRMGYKSFVTISKWESGDSKPRAAEMEKLCAIFNESIDRLLYVDLENEKTTNTNTIVNSARIKVFGRVAAGIPIEAIDDIVDWEDIPEEWTTGGREYFGVKVHGDSMFPKYMDGDTIIVRKQSFCESGQDCVVYVNGYNATLKRVIICPDQYILHPLNPLYDPVAYRFDDKEHPVTIAGVVVEIRRTV